MPMLDIPVRFTDFSPSFDPPDTRLLAFDEKIHHSDELGLPRFCDHFIDELKKDRDSRKMQYASTSNVACPPQEHLPNSYST